MDFMSILQWVLSFLNSIPAIGPYLVIVMNLAVPLSGIVTALVAVWHAVVLFLMALSKLPALSGLANFANTLSTAETTAEGYINTYVFPVLRQFSMLPLPKMKKPAAK